MTIINHTHRFVFVHIPKNAGTAVSQYLSQVSTYRDLEIGATEMGEAHAREYRRRFKLHKHSTHREIEHVMGVDELATYSTFAVVRDPYDRIRSIYSFLRSWKAWEGLDEFRSHAAEFATLETMDAFVMSQFFQTPGPDRLFMPQMTWIADEQLAEVRVDRLMRFEALSADVAQLVRDLDLPMERLKEPLHRANVSQRRMPLIGDHVARTRAAGATGFSASSKARIDDRYRRDFEILAAVTAAATETAAVPGSGLVRPGRPR